MRHFIIAALIVLQYATVWLGTCTTDANCSLIYYGEIRGGYIIVEGE